MGEEIKQFSKKHDMSLSPEKKDITNIFNRIFNKFMLQHHEDNEAKVFMAGCPFLMPTLLLYPGLELAGEYQKVNLFRELSGILTSKKVALRLKGKVYGACVRSSMIYGSETWAVNAEQEAKLERPEMRMVRWMRGVSLREKKTNAELRESMGIEKISDVMRRSRLIWMGHVLRKEGNDWVKKSMDMTVEGSRGRGRPKMTWEKVVERDMKVRGLVRNDAKDGVKWRALSWGAKG